jgi:hypothetical protein
MTGAFAGPRDIVKGSVGAAPGLRAWRPKCIHASQEEIR